MATNYSCGIERDEEVLKKNDADHTKWSNPLEIRFVMLLCTNRFLIGFFRLPNAPSMTMYCVYGHGKVRARSFPPSNLAFSDFLSMQRKPRLILRTLRFISSYSLAFTSTALVLVCIASVQSIEFSLNWSCRYALGDYGYQDNASDGGKPVCNDPSEDGCTPRSPLDMPLSRRSWIDSEYTNETISPKVFLGPFAVVSAHSYSLL